MSEKEEVKERMMKAVDETLSDVMPDDSKITFAKFLSILMELTRQLVFIAQESTLSGAEKKAAIADVLAGYYRTILEPVDIPYIPDWIESVLDQFILKELPLVVSYIIDKIVATVMTPWPRGGSDGEFNEWPVTQD